MKKLFALVLVVAMSLVSVAAFAVAPIAQPRTGLETLTSDGIIIEPTVVLNAPGYVNVEISQDGDNPALTFNKVYTGSEGYVFAKASNNVNFKVTNKSIASSEGTVSDTWDGSIYVKGNVIDASYGGVVASFTIAPDGEIKATKDATYTLTYSAGTVQNELPTEDGLETTVTFTISTKPTA